MTATRTKLAWRAERFGASPLTLLMGFMSRQQRMAVLAALHGEEREFFVAKMAELAARVAAMPKTYEQGGVADPIVSLHYFLGSCNWYITEKDVDTDGAGQVQAFGLADLFRDGGEFGYISIAEITALGAELDFYFAPRPLSEVRR